ncbi:MAG: hypothetical protein ABEJ99_01315 [Candidatus Nanohaloarchaea archaeon]
MGVNIWMVFEALGPDKEGVESSMEEHIRTLKNEKEIDVKSVEEEEVEEMEDPHPEMDRGYSQVIEVKADFDTFQKAIETVINYGPTYVQMEGPDKYEMDLAEGQNTLQSIATTMHQYAQMGAGGVLISKPSQDNS